MTTQRKPRTERTEGAGMSANGRVLVVDDDERWRNVIHDTLKRGGYDVDVCATADDARIHLSQRLYHLLVQDINLNDADRHNDEGLQLLRELDRRGFDRNERPLQVIILSSFRTEERIVRAFKELTVVDVLAKGKFDDNQFLEQVNRLFAEEMLINFALDIRWGDVKSAQESVLRLELDGERVRRDTPLQEQMAIQFTDLLQRLFFDARSIILSPMSRGMSGASVIRAQSFDQDGSGNPVVVKFGEFDKMLTEFANFKKFVEGRLGADRTTNARGCRRAGRLGGIKYSLLGFVGQKFDNFGVFYQRASAEQIRNVINDLFSSTCRRWYADLGRVEPLDLVEYYEQSLSFYPDKLDEALGRLSRTVHGSHKLTFVNLSDSQPFTNPIAAFRQLNRTYPTYRECVTHGDFNRDNILVDAHEHTWLIDFLRTGRGHVLRDVAQLDSVVRFELLSDQQASLDERLELEQALTRACTSFTDVSRLSGSFRHPNPDLVKAFETIVYLRQIAQRLVERNTDDIGEYYLTLLCYALNAIRFQNLPSTQREHALLSASILADRLTD